MNFQDNSEIVQYNPQSMHIVCKLVFTHASEENRVYINILWDSDKQSPIFTMFKYTNQEFYKINMPENDNYTLKEVIDKIGINYHDAEIRLYDGPTDPKDQYKFDYPLNAYEIFELPFFCIDYIHVDFMTNDWLNKAPAKIPQVNHLALKKKEQNMPTPEWVLKHHPWYQNAEKEFQSLFGIDM
jgi:hypothetical protein